MKSSVEELTLAFSLFGGRLNRPKGRFNTNFKEFDPGSGRTLAARLTHASRTVKRKLAFSEQWRTGE